MQPKLTNRTDHQKLTLISIFSFLMICQLWLSGCNTSVDQSESPTGAAQRIKPEGLLLITRDLDLGKLPQGGSMEILLSVKNPDPLKAFRVEEYEISGNGLRIEPQEFELRPGMSKPVSFRVLPEATQNLGAVNWEISAFDSEKALLFRSRLRLKVVENPNQDKTDQTPKN